MYILSAVVFLCPWTRELANPALTPVLSVTRTQVHQHNPSLKSTNLLLLTECHIGIQHHCKMSTTHSTISEYVLHCNSSTCQTSDFSADGVLLSAYFVKTFSTRFPHYTEHQNPQTTADDQSRASWIRIQVGLS